MPRLELLSDRYELLEVLDSALSFDSLFAFEVGQISGLIEHRPDYLRYGSLAPKRLQAAHGRKEIGQRIPGPRRKLHRLSRHLNACEKRQALLLGQAPSSGQRGIAYSAPGHVDDSLQAHGVLRVLDHPQVRQHVLDLAPLVELESAHDPVGYAPAHQHFFYSARLRVHPVQHRKIAVASLLCHNQAVKFVCDEAGLVLLSISVVEGDLGPRFPRGPQRLALSVAVVGDHMVRCVQNRLGRTVVLL